MDIGESGTKAEMKRKGAAGAENQGSEVRD
jgi:hypothetical protein